MSWLATYTGERFSLADPRPEHVNVEDIAHSLSHLCRFVGATSTFYSVAQHCVLVSRYCPPEYAFVGLMHDAAEAYCLDMPRPLKYMPGMEAYREIEDRVHRAVCIRFGLPLEIPKPVKDVDVALLMTERDLLLSPQPGPWDRETEPLDIPDFRAWSPRRAKRRFLQTFYSLQQAQYRGELAA